MYDVADPATPRRISAVPGKFDAVNALAFADKDPVLAIGSGDVIILVSIKDRSAPVRTSQRQAVDLDDLFLGTHGSGGAGQPGHRAGFSSLGPRPLASSMARSFNGNRRARA